MTNPSIRRVRGFTLIELLVVITIIAVLASAGFSAGMAALQKARRITALNVATSIEQAVNNFYNEYGYLPYDDPDGKDTDIVVRTDNEKGTNFIKVLLGKETTDSPLNTKAISFLNNIKEGQGSATKGRDGIIYENNDPKVIFDPWGGPYYVIMNTDYDDKIEKENITPKEGNKKDLNARNVAVWSNGADGVPPNTGKSADDVVTW
jgi:prepilin-type N-terminal cleavage/methylation domain-containing protein